jgi:hypothetical protein
VDFFIREHRARFNEEEEDEIQPPSLMEDEAMEMAIANSELDDLGQWDGLASNCAPPR